MRQRPLSTITRSIAAQNLVRSHFWIDLVVRPDEPPLGAGEASAVTVPAALANAVYDASGIRLRTVPFTRERVKAAFGA